MLKGDMETSKVNSICSLGEGSSFGESVIFGNKRETMIVTTDPCQLLCVDANHIRQIYDDHKDSMKYFSGAPGRPVSTCSYDTNHDNIDGRNSVISDSSSLAMEESQISMPVACALESELTLAGLTIYQIINEHFSDLIADHQVNMYTYKRCCSGQSLVNWVIKQSAVNRSRQQVIAMWQALLCDGIIEHTLNEHNQFLDDDKIYYRFVDRPIPESAKLANSPGASGRFEYRRTQSCDSSILESPIMSRSSTHNSISSGVEGGGGGGGGGSPTSSPRSSLSSLLEDCFELIAQLGPEALIYATLIKSPDNRSDDDIQLIYEELLHVKAFGHLSNAIKEELASVVQLENHPVAGKYLFKEGDAGTSWYIILKGSVNVLVGKDVMCTLHEGDEFGKLALLNNAPRTTSVQLREPNCVFLRVDRDDFTRILLSVEKNTVKIKEHGKEVLLLEKSTGGKYLVVKGTPQKMLEYLLTLDISPGGRDAAIDESFACDFFLTYPAFISVSELCDGLIKCYDSQAPPTPSPLERPRSMSTESLPAEATEEQLLTRRKRVVWAVSIWVSMAKAEVVKDPTFQKLLQYLQKSLAKDGLEEDQRNLNMCLMDTIKRSSYHEGTKGGGSSGLSIPFPMKKPSVSEIKIELGICAVPPCQPNDTVNLRIHTIDKKCCRLHVKLSSTSRDILTEACSKLGLDLSSHELCEIKSTGEKIIFKETDLSIATEMTVNGRLYALPKDSEAAISPLPDQNQKPIAPFPESEGSREIAAHLTSYDWNLFSNIQQMELIYQVFGRHRFSRITSNLDVMIRRFNEVQYWTVTEICKESNLQKRVKIIQKFIKIASHCKSFNNLNCFFAIVVGLMNGAITRLKQTWEKVSVKLRRRYEQFEALMDPSRNHRVLRAYQQKLQPPIIPFMPLIVKDAFFLQEGNETFVDGLVNFEKMRMVASKVNDFSYYRKGSLANEIKMLSNKNSELQRYIRDFKVIDSQQVLMQMSHAIESSKRTQATPTS
ncbi:PREDICTED: rap guanine nucleotide exchange factor 4-like isoform X2 [Amphimedon queenslandica]|nr:PREDICTED: rap guanine nucleotide exchange factor 4-like isoform X2 [Amphimedon queenslandica]|eukprot:XP_011404348.2 PREDICTED: rap guanine nucleotide exchange factor 4-like isoform X2 [Amphimedon queenslandica]